ncbi:MAG TPA: helix-turn-helix domain-containing protein [Segeticoccus sp.]|nr:helix-turn-helix domain-containing protein [Segeticoccus sp.]
MRQREERRDTVRDLSVLADPVRRRLYDYVAGQDGPVRREDAAAAADISRTLAAYHLDRLAEAGLLATSYARAGGRAGPGAGRPAKHYARVQDELAVTLPPRNYVLLARLLADAVAADGSGAVQAALVSAAEAEGRSTAGGGTDLVTTLADGGYEPALTDSGDLELRNCPFHQLSQRQTELVCGLNHALLRGILAGRGEDPDRAELAPRDGRCCVVVHPGRQPT